MNIERAKEIQEQVKKDRGGIWDARDQGRWAYAIGLSLNQNPHIAGHVNAHEWERGWIAEWRARS